MGAISSALRQNPHVLNYTLIGGGTLLPVLAYAALNAPTPEARERALATAYPAPVAASRGNAAAIVAFRARAGAGSPELDRVYDSLLRAGSASAGARAAHLEGALAAAEGGGASRQRAALVKGAPLGVATVAPSVPPDQAAVSVNVPPSVKPAGA